MDIKAGFLNTPLLSKAIWENKEIVIFRLSQILVRLGYCTATELWVAFRVMYGLHQVPRVWSTYRDGVITAILWKTLQGEIFGTYGNRTKCLENSY